MTGALRFTGMAVPPRDFRAAADVLFRLRLSEVVLRTLFTRDLLLRKNFLPARLATFGKLLRDTAFETAFALAAIVPTALSTDSATLFRRLSPSACFWSDDILAPIRAWP